MELLFKEAEMKDAKILVDLYNQAFYEDYVRFGFCPAYGRSEEQMKESIQVAKKHIIYLENHPVGVISIQRTGEGEYYLGCLGVIPKYQHKGIGTRAVNFAFKHYKDWKRFTLCTPEEKQNNVKFYRDKLGFSITGKNSNNGVIELLFEKVICK